MMTALLLIAALAGSFQDQAVSYSPKPAPRIYVSHKFGLMMKLPSGLSFCALPMEWTGSEDGTVLFLKPPSGCITTEADSSTARPISGFVPSITVSYRSNIGRYDHFDGEIPPSRTSEELAHQFCPDFSVSPDMRLFGQPALTCRLALNGNKVRIVFMSVYNSANSTLLVSLVTTKDRLKSDRKVLGKVASTISACKISSDDKERDDKEKSKGPVCPKATVW
jgi:hypothetical protein